MAYDEATEPIVQLFDDLVRCETRLYNALGESLRTEHGLAMSQFELLRYFRDHPDSRVAEVAANFAAGIGAISKGVDRLELRGWIARRPNPADGRSSLVSLTEAGSHLVAQAEGTFRDRLADLLTSVLGPIGIGATGKALSALRAALERDRVGLPVG
ncbi:MAG TPA: MarR family winged helix-turn-helix transcriptional regulator [Amnibacterium sp.]|jgi:DNA-binding MarR family transcriptional regulator|uniref:MarR family winged helix-turn-helix transcriptional regulator n=1 Tax=Amnibacterium sp. TaxID=1872496 RepID=UPI002F922513